MKLFTRVVVLICGFWKKTLKIFLFGLLHCVDRLCFMCSRLGQVFLIFTYLNHPITDASVSCCRYLDNLKTRSFAEVKSIKTFDFWILYTTLPHDNLKTRLIEISHTVFNYKKVILKNMLSKVTILHILPQQNTVLTSFTSNVSAYCICFHFCIHEVFLNASCISSNFSSFSSSQQQTSKFGGL